MSIDLFRRRVDLHVDGVTWKLPAPLVAVGLGSLLLAVLLAAADPATIAGDALDARASSLLSWENGENDAVADVEAPLRSLRREALVAGIEPTGDAAPSPCGGRPADHLAGHTREIAALSRALAAKRAADGVKLESLLPSRAPIELSTVYAPRAVARRDDVFVSSHEGTRADPFTGKPETHRGLDIAAPAGTSVIATADGTVLFAGSFDANVDAARSLLGTYVEIQHGATGYKTLYAHLESTSVAAGQLVHAGDRIGKVGDTGRSTGSHLHYQVTKDGHPVDPLLFIQDVALVEDGDSIRWGIAK